MQFECGALGMVDPGNPAHAAECAGVEPITIWYNRRLEQMVNFAPEQYWWLHRRWRTPPERVRRRLEAARTRTAEAA